MKKELEEIKKENTTLRNQLDNLRKKDVITCCQIFQKNINLIIIILNKKMI